MSTACLTRSVTAPASFGSSAGGPRRACHVQLAISRLEVGLRLVGPGRAALASARGRIDQDLETPPSLCPGWVRPFAREIGPSPGVLEVSGIDGPAELAKSRLGRRELVDEPDRDHAAVELDVEHVLVRVVARGWPDACAQGHVSWLKQLRRAASLDRDMSPGSAYRATLSKSVQSSPFRPAAHWTPW